ncbi:helix-turn-helix transcriptional regulator [Cupriavidus oxalaticus]|nr:helix-turn-helix transcriptional regulator [Cupriavidus oxalaticus]QRQ96090.1 helix-turn-helix transcriptional regulator [Cupriavidus oxalaticus]
METIGERLKAERLRLGLTQAEFGEALGVAKNVQSRYERGDRSPDPVYLAAIARSGVDVLYVLTGKRLPENAISLDAARVAAGQAYKAAQALGNDLSVEQFERLFVTLCDTTAAREEAQKASGPEPEVKGVHKVVQRIGAGSNNVQIGSGVKVSQKKSTT